MKTDVELNKLKNISGALDYFTNIKILKPRMGYMIIAVFQEMKFLQQIHNLSQYHLFIVASFLQYMRHHSKDENSLSTVVVLEQ